MYRVTACEVMLVRAKSKLASASQRCSAKRMIKLYECLSEHVLHRLFQGLAVPYHVFIQARSLHLFKFRFVPLRLA